MPKKKAKKSRKNKIFQARMILLVLSFAILFAVIIANMAFDWFSIGSKNLAADISENQMQRTGIKIYDINVPGSFFTFRNMGSSSISGNSTRIFINDAEVQCQEGIGDLKSGETFVCTNPLVKVCKTIKVTSPGGEDTAYCE